MAVKKPFNKVEQLTNQVTSLTVRMESMEQGVDGFMRKLTERKEAEKPVPLPVSELEPNKMYGCVVSNIPVMYLGQSSILYHNKVTGEYQKSTVVDNQLSKLPER
jgi:hypothetical protein